MEKITEGFIHAERLPETAHEVTHYRYRPEWVNASGKVVAYEWLWDAQASEKQWHRGRNFKTMAFLTKLNATR